METLILNIIHSGYLLLPHNTFWSMGQIIIQWTSDAPGQKTTCIVPSSVELYILYMNELLFAMREDYVLIRWGVKKTKQHSFKMNVLILQNVFFFRGIYKIKNGGKMFIFNIRSVFHMIHMEITAPYTIYSLNIFCYSNIRATFNILFQDNIKAHRRSLYSCLHLKQ